MALPTSLDWRNYGGNSYVTPVKEQGSCGACWAFAATAALESYVLICQNAPGQFLDLSEQTLISCGGAGTCSGGYVDLASDFIRSFGLPLEDCHPYAAMDGFCSNGCSDWSASSNKITDWSRVNTDVNSIKYALYNHGPLVTLMAAQTDFLYYGSGIYSHTTGGFEGYHAALIVGYDDAGQYFIVKSSFGTDWGEEGYFRIAYSEIGTETAFGIWTIAYEGAIPPEFPTIDGIPRNPGSYDGNGQDGNGQDSSSLSTLTGTIRDGSGKAVNGAIISIAAGKYSTTTNQSGKYRISSIPSGDYIVIVSKEGYTSLTENVHIASDNKTTRDFVLSGSFSDNPNNQNLEPEEEDNSDDIDNPDKSYGPGWFRVRKMNITSEKADAYFVKKRMERLLNKTGEAPLASTATDSTPEIQGLARALRNDPKLIYDYVHNNIDYVPYFGSRKGATLTYFDGSGNDFDQASLMIALLREAGFTAQYVYGTMTIPGDRLANWLDVDQTPATIDSVLSHNRIAHDYPQSGEPIGTTSGIKRVWVKALIGGSYYLFDPAFKNYTPIPKIEMSQMGQALGYSQGNFLNGAGGTPGDNGYSVQNMNEFNIRSILSSYASNLINTIRTQYPNQDVNQIVGGRTIVQENLTEYQSSLPFSPSVTEEWSEILNGLATTLRIRHAGIDYTIYTPDFSGKRLTLTYTPGECRPDLRLDGNPSGLGNPTTCGSINNMDIDIQHPLCSVQSVQYSPKSGMTYAIVYNFGGVSDALLRKRQQQLEVYRSQEGDNSQNVLLETLNIMGQTWLKEVAMSNRLFSALADTIFIQYNNIGLMAQEAGYYIDVKAGLCSVTSKHNITADRDAHFKASALIASSLEHGMLEQLMGSNNPSVSTIKLLQIANFNNNKVFYANKNNYDGIQEQLVNYDPNDKMAFQTWVNTFDPYDPNAVFTLILPKDGNLSLLNWHGKGYIQKRFSSIRASMGMIIGGGYNGGYGGNPENIEIPTVSGNINANISTTPSPVNINNVVTTNPVGTSRDPVEMAGGAFLYDRTDLALGGGAPLGLAFSRSYTSSKNLSKRTMGYGFTHNYDIFITPTSHGEPGLGNRQPVDAAGMIGAFYVILDLMKNQDTDTIQAWMAASLAAKWAVDQVIDNAVTVNLGGKAMEFIKLQDGTYAPPPGITTQLIKNGDNTYSLLERFGTRMNFNTNKQISQIIDVDNNPMAFTYSGADLYTVQDSFGRTLTFSSTSGRINSVTDNSSPARTVYYGYDSNTGNLTSYTDPEGQVWGYGYDSSHRMTSLTNPLTVTTATNAYDSLGRVMTQTVPRQGGGTATYNFYFSGFRNQEVDPAGNALTYYYDDKGREYALENALGHKTTKEFDGQDHTLKVTDPRGYITNYIYDGHHNLTKVTNALNYEINNTYDTQYRLTDILDPLSHNTHFTYDAEHHLTQTQDALNTTIGATYYGNGLKNTATDGRGTTTTFTYDSFGNLDTSQTGSHPVINYTYDKIGRMTELTDQVNSLTSFVYDKRNLLTLKTDPLTRQTSFHYDNAGRLDYKIDRLGNRIDYSYTPSDKINTITYPSGTPVGFTYNNLDYLTGMQDSIGNTSYAYDAAGRLTSMTDPQGFTIGYQYDQSNPINQNNQRGLLTTVTYPGPGNKTVTYTYDELNRLQTVTNWLSQTVTYEYDAAGRLTSLTNFNGTVTTFGYDNANRLTSQNTPSIATYQFALDGNGNRKNTVQNEPLLAALPPVGTTTYTYNTQKNRLLSAGSNNFTYDYEGQLNTGYSSYYTFDYEHRLIGIGSDQFFYDGSGNRLRAIRGSVTTRYIYGVGGNLLAEADGLGNITKYYIHGLGLLAMVTPSDQTYCYHFNPIGSTIAMTNQSQTMVNQYVYDPFGKVTNQTETVLQPFKFVGQHGIMTEPNGFYYMRARYYDPGVGRFISEDPIGFDGGGINLNAYVGNNPLMSVDPDGKLAFYWHFGITYVAARNSGYGVGEGLKLAWNVMKQDRSAFNNNTDQTKIHAMGGQLPGGGYQTPDAAMSSAVNYINTGISPGTIHAAQDLPVHAGQSMEDYSFFSMHTVRDITGGGTIGQAYQNTLNVLNGSGLSRGYGK